MRSGTGLRLIDLPASPRYNAGKSTLIRCITGDENVKISSDVCTSEVSFYDWNGLRIVDTPGVMANEDEQHDKLSERQIMETHLIIFVITTELFEKRTGDYFRELAFARGRASEIMLVVNKVDADDGGPEVKRTNIEKVTKKPMEYFRTIFVSGERYLKALKMPAGPRRDNFVQRSGIAELVKAIDAFAKERGNLGKLTTPLVAIQSIASQAAGLVESTREEVRVVLELLGKRTKILRESRKRLEEAFEDLLHEKCRELRQIGSRAAMSMDPAEGEEEVAKFLNEKQEEFGKLAETIKAEAETVIEKERVTVDGELDALQMDNLVDLLARLLNVEQGLNGLEFEGASARVHGMPSSGPTTSPSDETSADGTSAGSSANGAFKPSTGGPSPALMQQIGSKLKSVGQWSMKLFPNGLNPAAVAGTSAHKMVYNAGKWLGVNFKPWGAVKVAAGLGKFLGVVGLVGSAFEIYNAYSATSEAKKREQALDSVRNETRYSFDEKVAEVRRFYKQHFDEFLVELYRDAINETEETKESLQTRGEKGKLFREIAEEAKRLMQSVETKVIAAG